MDEFLNAGALELGDRTEDASNEAAGGRRRVNGLAERDERNAARLPFAEEEHQRPQVATETIESPAHHRAWHLVLTDIGHQLVERRLAVLRAVDALFDVLDGTAVPRLDIAPPLE